MRAAEQASASIHPAEIPQGITFQTNYPEMKRGELIPFPNPNGEIQRLPFVKSEPLLITSLAQAESQTEAAPRSAVKPQKKTPDVIELPYIHYKAANERDVFRHWGRHNQRLGQTEAYDDHPEFGSVHFNTDRKIMTDILTKNGVDRREDKAQFDIQVKLLPEIGLPIRNFVSREQRIRKEFFESPALSKYRGSLQIVPADDTVFISGHSPDETVFITSPKEIGQKDKVEIHGTHTQSNGSGSKTESSAGTKDRDSSAHYDDSRRVYIGKKGEERLTLEEVLKNRMYQTYGISENPEAQEVFGQVFGSDISFMVTNQRRVLKILHHHEPELGKFRRQKERIERRKKSRGGVVFEANGINENGEEGNILKFKSSAKLREDQAKSERAA